MRGGLSCQGWDSYNLTTKYLPITKDIYPLLKRKEADLDDCDVHLRTIKYRLVAGNGVTKDICGCAMIWGDVYEILVLYFSKLYVRCHIQFRTWFWPHKTPNRTPE